MANIIINQSSKPYTNLALTNPNPAVFDSISGYTENGMVVLSVSYKAGLQNWAATITVPTLPNKCYPRQKVNGTPRYESTSDVRAVFCSLDADGKISAFLNAPALQYPITFTFVYPERI